MKKRTRSRIRVSGILLGIAIAFIVLVTGILTLTGLMEISVTADAHRFLPGEDSIHYSISGENYYNALANIRRLEAAGVNMSEDMKECSAVAHYYEAAILNKAFTEAGDSKKAGQEQERMKEYSSGAGSLSMHIEKIDALLERPAD